MTRIYLLIFCYISNPALSEPATWLMQGDKFTEDDVISRVIQLESHKSYFPMNSTAEMYYRAPPGKLIQCVIAASVYGQGHVSVVEGGYRTNKVRVNYTTESGKADVFYFFIQTVKREAMFVDENTRLGIVYGPMRSWTLAEIQDYFRNNSNIFPS
ncbi:PREDICTED: uncharacterized protein LOC108752692 isoform X1 [Trachymyrmex septentrionalis]|uniref:uncharacterized protein LOC108752692 isoform X1 n=1 Tax=Trachymyrmex septentrionalis TaxID=34720 RepID=UPI00084F57D9|nr:PREDICTED: uncharacterized protein LOC108752692 isoform X1 [Trachymyrmex septentrionalis]